MRTAPFPLLIAGFLIVGFGSQAFAQSELQIASALEVKVATISATTPVDPTQERRLYARSSWGAPPMIAPRLIDRTAQPVSGASEPAKSHAGAYDPERPRHAGGIPVAASSAAEPASFAMMRD
jgi:hypothetical protein